jgi:hypothetical protein
MEQDFSSSEDSAAPTQQQMLLNPDAPATAHAESRQSNFHVPAGSEKIDLISPTPTRHRMTSVYDGAKDIPVEMATATMEAGKKRKLQNLSFNFS